MKQILTLLFTLLVVTLSYGATRVQLGGLYYNLDSTNKTAEVSNQSSYLTGNLVIPETEVYEGITYSVISIGNYAFLGCSGLTSVEIPNSLTSIGSSAFEGCSGLKSVEIPNSVTSIGDKAFYDCYGLTSVVIPNSVTSIGSLAFYDCSGLIKSAYPSTISNPFYNGICIKYPADDCEIEDGIIYGKNRSAIYFVPMNIVGSFEIPNSVTSIGYEAFSGCSGLKSVEIPNSVTSIGSSAFRDCTGLTSVEILDIAAWCGISFKFYDSNPLDYAHNLYLNGKLVTNLEIPNSVTEIRDYSFSGCSGLTSVVIPNSVISIGNYAFYNCNGLTSVEIGNSVTSIGDYAFEGCNGLTSVTIPNSVTSIGGWAFLIGSLTELIFNAENCSYCGSKEYPSFPSNITSLTIGKDVKTLPAYVFNGLSNMTSVEIPNSVTLIGENAFRGCYGLTSVEIPNSVTSIGYEAFYGCSGLTSVEIGNSVTSIGSSAFYGCSGLTSVVIPNSVTSIGEYAFRNCSGLIKSAYPSTISNPFSNGISIQYPADDCEIEDGIIYVKNRSAIYFVPMNRVGSFEIPNSVTSIGDSAFYGCSDLTSVTIPTSVTSIGYEAFYGCSGLTSVTIPNSVTSIGEWAFSGCSSLSNLIFNAENCTECGSSNYPAFPSNINSLTIGNDVKTIPAYAFQKLTTLTSVTIPNSVTEIGRDAFYGCSGLTSVEISDIAAWCGISFGNYYSNPLFYARNLYLNGELVANLDIPNSVTEIRDYSFYGCSSLTGLNFPPGITSIGRWAFSYCDNLEIIIFNSDRLLNLGTRAFDYCDSLTEIYCNTTRPPVSNDFSVFENDTYSTAKLYVPEKDLSLYYSMTPWSKFFNIIATDSFPTLGVENVVIENSDTEDAPYYNLNGQIVKNPTPGIYIHNGRKVIVK